jgi:hypothetical protein
MIAGDAGSNGDAATSDAGPARITRGGPICPGPGESTCYREAGLPWKSFGYEETPPNEDDFSMGQHQALKIVRRVGVLDTVTDGYWTTLYEVTSDRPSTGRVGFLILKPHAVPLDALPDELRLYRFGVTIGCFGWGPGGPEGTRLGRTTMRDSSGSVLWSAGASPLRPDGSVMTPPGDELGFSLRWKDAGCAPCAAPPENGGFMQRTVAIEVTLATDGSKHTLLPGQPLSLDLGGRQYTFVVDSAELPVVEGQNSLCGIAVWYLYRDGMLVELNPDGTVKQ